MRSQTRRLPRIGFLAIALLFTGANLGAADSDRRGVLALARAAIIARVGDAFFNRYIGSLDVTTYPPDEHCSANPNGCSDDVRKGYSFVTYRLRMPELDFVDEPLGCVVGSDGEISSLAAPKCESDPRECTFPYDEAAAQEIARAAGLQPGLRPWTTSFHWHYGLETFVWTVSNTLNEAKGSADGRIVLIDANDGRVISVDGWYMMS